MFTALSESGVRRRSGFSFFREKNNDSTFVLIKSYLGCVDNINSIFQEKSISAIRELQEQNPAFLERTANHLIKNLLIKDVLVKEEGAKLLKALNKYVDEGFIQRAVVDFCVKSGKSKTEARGLMKSIGLADSNRFVDCCVFISKVFKKA